MSYPDSVKYLYALGNEVKAGLKLGLEPMRILLAALGHPEKNQRFVHVAGTNGKGSTCALLESILRESGLRTGLYTSPHLIEPTERIQIAGSGISRDEFERLFARVHECAESLLLKSALDAHPSYFETVTAMALCAFHSVCEMSVIEVGLGGRLDATNVIYPLLTIITPVDYDHEAYLGNTLAAIALEKAGILKQNVPVVVGHQGSEAMDVILKRAGELECSVLRADAAVPGNVNLDASGSRFDLEGVAYVCPLAGAHQVDNALAAILAARELGIATDVIQRGLQKTRWPGRLEYMSHCPDLILDGAHNPAGARALAEYIKEFRGSRPVWMVFGAMRDKALDEVVNQLFPVVDKVILTAPEMPRALRPQALQEMHSHPNMQIAPTLSDAITEAKSAPPEAMVFFSGSLYLVGEVRRVLLNPA